MKKSILNLVVFALFFLYISERIQCLYLNGKEVGGGGLSVVPSTNFLIMSKHLLVVPDGWVDVSVYLSYPSFSRI